MLTLVTTVTTFQKIIDIFWSLYDQKIQSSKRCQTEKWKNISYRESLVLKTNALIYEDKLARFKTNWRCSSN